MARVQVASGRIDRYSRIFLPDFGFSSPIGFGTTFFDASRSGSSMQHGAFWRQASGKKSLKRPAGIPADLTLHGKIYVAELLHCETNFWSFFHKDKK